ncbi:hypothetical protein C0Z01_06435 [Photobacterium kishitanii]|nr:hypothetical protein C0Z01_06435 [Photobacterium kishitanii]
MFLLSILVIGYYLENNRNNGYFRFPFVTFVILIFYHDFIFINAAYYFKINEIVLSSSWKEIILLILTCYVILYLHSSKIKYTYMRVIIFSIVGVLWGLFRSSGPLSESILIGKDYIFPFLFFCSLCIIQSSSISIKKVCNIFFFIVVMPNFLFGIWELFNVKNMHDIWFYEPLLSLGHGFASFNHFRNGIIRCNGFFVGTLSFAVTGFCSFIIFFIMRKEKYSYIKILVSFSMLLMSQSRIFFVGLLFFFILYLFYYLSKKKIDVIHTLVFLLGSFLLVLFILPFVSSDGSALGRITQWSNALNLLITHPFGQGFSSIGITGDNRADSYIIDLIRIYGIYSIVLLYLSVSFIVTRINSISYVKYSEVPLLLSISFIYILFFQSLLDTPILYFIILLIVKVKSRKDLYE